MNPRNTTPNTPNLTSSPPRPHLVSEASPADAKTTSSPAPLYYVGGRGREPQTTSSPTSSETTGRGHICGATKTTTTGTWTCTITGPHNVTTNGRTRHHFTKTTNTPTEAATNTRHAAPIPEPSTVSRDTGQVTTSTPGTNQASDPTADATPPGPVTLTEAHDRGRTWHHTGTSCTTCGEPNITHAGIHLDHNGHLRPIAFCDHPACQGIRNHSPNQITQPINTKDAS